MKKGPVFAAFGAIALCAALAAAAEPAAKAPVAIRAARLLDVKSGRYVDHPVVVVVGRPDRQRRHRPSRRAQR